MSHGCPHMYAFGSFLKKTSIETCARCNAVMVWSASIKSSQLHSNPGEGPRDLIPSPPGVHMEPRTASGPRLASLVQRRQHVTHFLLKRATPWLFIQENIRCNWLQSKSRSIRTKHHGPMIGRLHRVRPAWQDIMNRAAAPMFIIVMIIIGSTPRHAVPQLPYEHS